MISFDKIHRRATERKGGPAALASLLPTVLSPRQLAEIPDDRMLCEMTRRIFCSGFSWAVIDKKWPDFEQAFLGFDPSRLVYEPEEFWDRLVSDKRIVRNGQKIMAVRANSQFILDIAGQHGSFGRFLADWPSTDQIGLLELLTKRGARLGGNSGQYFLRFVGKDGFMLSRDVVLCLLDAGLEVAETPTSKRDLTKIQAQFNDWAKKTGLPYTHLSRICAMSIGENVPAEKLRMYSE